MTSSLALQLKRLSVPNNSLACHAPDKRRASLLFDSKDAAMLDRDQVFSIGVNGLAELENINSNFEKFEKILFTQSSITLDRTLQTKEVNEQINDVITEFLAAVSPFFLMKAAQKCLEWLVYRFYIHQMNVNEFILCILPHHDSEMFPRALKLVKIDDPTNMWHFLNECPKMNVPLPRRVLLNRCRKDHGFLSFLCSHFSSQTEKLRSWESSCCLSLNLYTILMLGVINKRTEINENLVKTVVTNVEKGMKSRFRDQKAANYMILCQLTTVVVPLRLQVTLRLLDVLLKNIEPSLCKEAIFCLNVVMQNQKIDKLPEGLLATLTSGLQDLPSDEMSSSLRIVLDRLISSPPAVEEGMAVDETDHSSSVLNDLGHRKPSKRVAGVRRLAAMMEDETQELSARFFEDALLNCLRDKDHKVVCAVLELNEKLVGHVEKVKLLMSLVDVVERKYSHSKWRVEVELAVKMICMAGVSLNASGLTLAFLGWLLVTDADSSNKGAACARSILCSDISKEDRVMKALPVADLCKILEGALEEDAGGSFVSRITDYNSLLISSLADFLVSLTEAELKATMLELTDLRYSSSGRGRFLLVSSLSVAMNNSTGNANDLKIRRLNIASCLLELLRNQSFSEDEVGDIEDLEKDHRCHLVPWLSYLRKTGLLPVGLVQWSILQMITALRSYDLPEAAERTEPMVTVLLKIFEIIASFSTVKAWQQMRFRIETEIDKTSLLKVVVIMIFDVIEKEGSDPKWVTQGVSLLSFEMLQSICTEILPLQSLLSLPVMPSLVLSLLSDHQNVRLSSIRCLQKICKNYRLSEGSHHGSLLKKLLKRKQLVMVDHEYASEVGYELFRALSSSAERQTFVSQMVDLVMRSSEPFLAKRVKACLKELKIEGEHVSHELTLPEGDVPIRKDGGKKKARVTKNLDVNVYKRVVLILEVLESQKKLGNAAETTGILFKLLSRLNSESGERADHCRQLTLACLCGICKRWKSSDLSSIKDHLNKKDLDVESLRLCISDSVNSQVQQLALTLLAFIAPLYPEYVLTNAVAIFTFMGTSLVQLDNSYTFHVIISTIDAVVSAVVNAQPATENDPGTNSVLIDLIRIFVDAREHIPGHRRLPLFHHLVEQVGVEAYLWSLIVLVVESSVQKLEARHTAEEKAINKDVELIANICSHFSGDVQLRTVTKIVIFLQNLLSSLSKGSFERLPIVANVSVRSVHGLLVHLSRTAMEILGRRELIAEVLTRSEGNKVDKGLEDLLHDLILQSLKYLTETTRLHGNSQLKVAHHKFWDVLMAKVPKILHKATYLLPTASFLEVIQSLLEDALPNIQLKAFDILVNKFYPQVDGQSTVGKVLAMNLTNLAEEEMASLEKLISKLIQIVKNRNSDRIKCQQMAIYTLQILCAQLGKEKPQLFAPVIPVVVEIVAARDTPTTVFDVGLMCLSEMCRTLGSRQLLKYLHKLMVPILALLEDTKFLLSKETTLLRLLVAVKEIIKTFSESVDSYLTRLMRFVCVFPTALTSDVNLKELPKIEELLKLIINEMATKLESRVLLPKALETFKMLLETNQVGLARFYSFIGLHISAKSTELRRKSDDLLLNLVELFDEGMNLRSTAAQLTWDEMLLAETKMIESIYAMVLPLTDNQFSTIFQKLFSYVATENSQEYKLRQLTFFHLTDTLVAKLQDLFIKYALHVLTAASDFLIENDGTKPASWFTGDDAEKKTCLMLEYIIGCLHKCMLFDRDGSFGIRAVKKVMYPIIQQLENFVGGEAEYKKRIVEHVVPCTGQLIIAAKRAGTWKDLSYQICLKSRNSNPMVRIASLLTIEEMARKLGHEYDGLLPETTPFLAELLEDDDAEVAKECHRVKGVLEEVLGELLNDCFQ